MTKMKIKRDRHFEILKVFIYLYYSGKVLDSAVKEEIVAVLN